MVFHQQDGRGGLPTQQSHAFQSPAFDGRGVQAPGVGYRIYHVGLGVDLGKGLEQLRLHVAAARETQVDEGLVKGSRRNVGDGQAGTRRRSPLDDAAAIDHDGLLHGLGRRLEPHDAAVVHTHFEPFHDVVIRQIQLILHVSFHVQALVDRSQGVFRSLSKGIVHAVAYPMIAIVDRSGVEVDTRRIDVGHVVQVSHLHQPIPYIYIPGVGDKPDRKSAAVACQLPDRFGHNRLQPLGQSVVTLSNLRVPRPPEHGGNVSAHRTEPLCLGRQCRR